MARTDCKKIQPEYRNIVAIIQNNGIFFLQFLKHPHTVGSVCPSSPALTRQLLAGISTEERGLVIDLGSGSGSVSESMVNLGIAKDRIIAVEALAKFKAPFAARCPGIPIVIGDARNLRVILNTVAPGREISAVVSSLPFRTMSPALTKSIIEELHQTLQERGGRLVQYTYAWWLRYPLQQYGFIPDSAAIVWKNLPPARVESYGAGVRPRRHAHAYGSAD